MYSVNYYCIKCKDPSHINCMFLEISRNYPENPKRTTRERYKLCFHQITALLRIVWFKTHNHSYWLAFNTIASKWIFRLLQLHSELRKSSFDKPSHAVEKNSAALPTLLFVDHFVTFAWWHAMCPKTKRRRPMCLECFIQTFFSAPTQSVAQCICERDNKWECQMGHKMLAR